MPVKKPGALLASGEPMRTSHQGGASLPRPEAHITGTSASLGLSWQEGLTGAGPDLGSSPVSSNICINLNIRCVQNM